MKSTGPAGIVQKMHSNGLIDGNSVRALLLAERRARRRLQLSPPPRMAEAFVAQNPDCVQPTHPAQIRLIGFFTADLIA